MPFILNQRQVSLLLIGGTAVLTALSLLLYLITGTSPEAIGPTAAVAIIFSGLFLLYWRGWEPARYVAALAITLLAVATIPTQNELIAALIPMTLALALTDTRWVAGIGVAVLLTLIVRGGFGGAYVLPGVLVSYMLALCGLVCGAERSDWRSCAAQANVALSSQFAVRVTPFPRRSAPYRSVGRGRAGIR
jgi:hypothetical protein